MEHIWFFIGAAIFVAVFWLACRHWWHRLDGITPTARITLIATTVGGLIGAVFWWLDTEGSFAWNLPPLASRMLGAAATAFGIAGLFVLERPTAAHARLHSMMTAVYLAPLALAIVAFHLDRFDLSAPISWGFFAIVIMLIVTGLAGTFTTSGLAPATPLDGIGGPWLFIAGAVLGIWSLALFAIPAAPYPPIFIWPSDALTSRLIAAMLMTLAIVFLVARKDRTLSPQAYLFGAVYGFGVAIAVLINVVRDLPWPAAYLFALGAVGLISAALLIAGRSDRQTGR